METKRSSSIPDARTKWSASKQDRKEQDLTWAALQTNEFDNWTDDAWCHYMETLQDA